MGNENTNRRSGLLTLCFFFVNVSLNMGLKAMGTVSNVFGANALLQRYCRHNDHTPGSSTYVRVCLLHHDLYDMIYLLTAIWLTTGGSSTEHIYTQTIHRTTQSTQTIHRTTLLTNQEECGPCPVFARYTLASALQLRKKHGKTSVMVRKTSVRVTAIGLPPGVSSTVHIYAQTIHRTTQFTNQEECGPCPVFARYTLAFALQLRKKHGKTSVRVAGECQLAKNITSWQRIFIVLKNNC